METEGHWLRHHVWPGHTFQLPVAHVPVDATTDQVCSALHHRQHTVNRQYHVPSRARQAVQEHGAAAPSAGHVCVPCIHCWDPGSGLHNRQCHPGDLPAHHPVHRHDLVLRNIHTRWPGVPETHGIQELAAAAPISSRCYRHLVALAQRGTLYGGSLLAPRHAMIAGRRDLVCVERQPQHSAVQVCVCYVVSGVG